VSRPTERLFLATVFAVTFEKVHWNVAGSVSLADILATLFLVAFAVDWAAAGKGRVPKAAAVLLAFFGAFLLVYLVGFFNLDTKEALDQFGKGMVKFVLHFLFLAAGVVLLARRSERFYWRTLGWFSLGVGVNAFYGLLQLAAAQAGRNLDTTVLSPLTGGASSINIYGGVSGTHVYRPNALSADPNHLGIMLLVPLLVLTPLYLRLERGHRLRLPLALGLAFLLVIEFATLSRSGLLGLAVGTLVLAVPYRRKIASKALLAPLAVVAAVVGAVVVHRSHFFVVVLRSRLQHGGASTSAHLGVYDFIPQILHSHPLFGLGLNNFSVYYQFVTGKTNWGPHSFYVALLVESGLVGSTLFGLFLLYLFRRLQAARQIGRALSAARDPLAARVRPVAWGLTAALLGTMAANAFYLTMTFYYFYAFALLVVALPMVFARRLALR
jgi:O-antigen ligase